MLSSQLEIVQQAQEFLTSVSLIDYTTQIKPHLAGSAGAHMRHVVDHYHALIHGLEDGVVDYNKRDRFGNIETDPKAALLAWGEIATWLEKACLLDPSTPLSVMSETSIQQTEYVTVQSNIARELVFVSSHAIHHFSLLAVIRSLQGEETPEFFGVAPATVTYLKKQA